jgi:hypothetical protein
MYQECADCTLKTLVVFCCPALRWRIDVACNRCRYPADTKAEKDQEDGLHALIAPDYQYEEEYNCPGDGEANVVDPIVSEEKHLMHLCLSEFPFPGKNPYDTLSMCFEYIIVSAYPLSQT